MYVVPLATRIEETFKTHPFGGINGDKPTVAQIIEKCTDFCGTQKFVFVSMISATVSLFRTS